MRYDGDEISQIQLKFQATKFYLQTKSGCNTREENKIKFDISSAAKPLDIVNKAIDEIGKGNITQSEITQLIEISQAKQKIIDLQPEDKNNEKNPTLKECLEIANKLLPTANIMELQNENTELKKRLQKLEGIGNA